MFIFQGATVKNEGESVIIGRIVKGGAAEKSGKNFGIRFTCLINISQINIKLPRLDIWILGFTPSVFWLKK